MTGWNRCIDFNNWFETDPYLVRVPDDWKALPGQIKVNFRDFVVVSFIQKLCLEENICSGTVSVYLSAVRYYYKLANLNITFFESDWISAARTGINLVYLAKNPVAGRKAMSFVCEMIIFAETKVFNTNSEIDHAILSAMKLASTCLMRVSEYLPYDNSIDHWMRSEDVAFKLTDGRLVPSWRAHLY